MYLTTLIIADLSFAFGIAYIFTGQILFSLVYSLILLLVMFSFRAFEEEHISETPEQLVRTTISAVFSALFVVLVYSFVNVRLSFHKLAFSSIVSIIVISLLNSTISKIMMKHIKPKKYLVIGRKREISHILDEITKKSKGKYLFVDYINPSPAVLKKKIKTYDNVLVANYELYKHIEYLLENSHVKVEYLSELAEKVLKRIPLEVIDHFKEYYELEFQKANESPAKRMLDIFGAIVGLIVFSPFILISAIFILIEDGPPVTFKQFRVGKDNKEFLLVKLRSMRKERDGKAKFADQEKDRILKIGKIIRPTRIDESLQFWNILKGEMSIVGPRPEQIPFVREFEQKIPYYNYRHKLKPGLTGWAQIMYQYSSTLEQTRRKLEYDLYYIKNRSIFMDLRIMLQTIEAIFWRRGAK